MSNLSERASSGSAAAIVYVCDQTRLHQLALSLFSWRRFIACDVFVVDFGLSEAARQWLSATCAVRLLPPLAPPIRLSHVAKDIRRINAYREKSRIGLHGAWSELGDRPLIYLDADIFVTERSFVDVAGDVAHDTLSACRSAWDEDFNWTYKPEALSGLRTASGLPDLLLTDPIPNSGVTCARVGTWRRVSTLWAEIYDAFLAMSPGSSLLHDGTLPGDQEFLALACRRCGVRWTRLHGSCNMQVDPRRMRWGSTDGRHPTGGRFEEPPEPVRAVHFGCDPFGRLELPIGALGTDRSRIWLENDVATVWATASAAGLQTALSG